MTITDLPFYSLAPKQALNWRRSPVKALVSVQFSPCGARPDFVSRTVAAVRTMQHTLLKRCPTNFSG